MGVLTGAPAPATVDGAAVAHAAPFVLKDGTTLRLGAPSTGLRTYLSVRGGVDVPPVLGSRAADTLSGLGPPPLRPGDLLRVGPPPHGWPNVEVAPLPAPDAGPIVLRALPGPRADWTVSPRSDRIGIRLDGRRVESGSVPATMLSEGLIRGAIQLPPDGRPILFLADHPVTGGYPVVAVVSDADADRAAQAVPGARIVLGAR
jgi:allophanate hydrolase subunit 2